MGPKLAELLGIMLGVVGVGLLIGTAAMVSTPLAVLVAGVAALFASVLIVTVANAQAAETAKAQQAAQAAAQLPPVQRYGPDD